MNSTPICKPVPNNIDLTTFPFEWCEEAKVAQQSKVSYSCLFN